MLANLLPGLREIRAPVVSGYLWLVFFFLALHSWLPSSSHPGSTLRPLFDLAGDLSVLGVATVASVGAYLVGSAMQELLKLLLRLLSPGRPLYARAGTHITPDGHRSLVRTVRIQVDRITRRLFQIALSPGERGIDQAPPPEVVVRDLPLVRTLLLGEHPELAGELDRIQAEADLRITVAAPLAALSVFLVFELSLGWAVGLILAAMLFVQGLQRQREAGDFLVGVLQMGRIEAPAVKEFGVSIDAALERTELEWQLKNEMTEGDGMAAFRYANLLASSREFKKAVEPLDFAIGKGVLQAYAELGLAWQELDDLEKAERVYRDGAERGDLKARERLGALLRELERGEEALEVTSDDRGSAAEAEEEPKEGDGEGEEALDLPRRETRLADYQDRAGRGDAKAALNLGLLLVREDRLPAAIDAFRRAIDLDPEDPEALVQLGRAQVRDNKFAEAREAFEIALKLQEAELGPEHLEVGATLGRLGVVLSNLGHDEQALSAQERALEIQERELGSDDFAVLVARGNVARTLVDLGRYEVALPIQESLLESVRRLAGERNGTFASTLNNLGNARLFLGDHKGALIAYERAQRLNEDLGGRELAVSINICNSGHARNALGEYGRALGLHEEALGRLEEILGDGVVGITDALDGKGESLNRLGRYAEALDVLDRSWGIKEAHSVSKLRVGETQLLRAEALAGNGELGWSVAAGQNALTIFEEALGENSFFAARARVILGESEAGQGRLQRAERLLEAAIESGEASEDEREFFLSRALQAMARVKIRRDELGAAEEFASRAIKVTEARYGQFFPELATALEVWADVRAAAGESQAAEVARQRAREIRRRLESDSNDSGDDTDEPG